MSFTRVTAIALNLSAAASLLTPAALAQSSPLRTGSDLGRDTHAVFDRQPATDAQSTGNRSKPSVRRTFTRTIDPRDGEVELWTPNRAKDLAARFVNRGTQNITVIMYPATGAGSPISIALNPSAMGMPGAIRGMAQAARVTAICNASGTQSCKLDLELRFAAPDGGVGDNIHDGFWFASNDYHGSISDPADSTRDCLWNFDTLWESVTPRDMDVFFEATGPHDVQVEIQEEGGVSAGFEVNGLDAGIVHTNGGDYYDVIKVETRCQRSPTSACSPCNFDYSLTVED